MKRGLCGLFLAFCGLGGAIAAQEGDVPQKRYTIKARKNPGNLLYQRVISGQKRLQSFLPPEPRMLDFMFRIYFTELPVTARDAYDPKGWGVAVVGDTLEQIIPTRRGGYFLVPEIAAAYDEEASLMIKEQSQPYQVVAAWILRVGTGRRLAYADFGKAIDEIKGVQMKIPIYSPSIRTVKRASYDSLKACFLNGNNELRIDGKRVVPDAMIGNCAVLKFDPARRNSDQTIEFSGPLDIVTLVGLETELAEKG